MAELKSARHEAFVQEYLKDDNGSRSYKAVYGENVKGAAQSAKKLLEHADIQARLIEVRAALAVRAGMSQEQIVEDFEKVYKKGMANPERGGLAAAHQAKSAQAKVLGFATGKEKKPADEMTDDELVKQIREDTGNDRLANLWAATLKHSRGEDITADLAKIETDLRQAVELSHSNGKDKQPPTPPTEA